MGYNLSRSSFERNKPTLEALMHREESLQIPHAQPRRLAYKLREALRAAAEFEDTRKYYDYIWPRFRFREVAGAVLCEYVVESYEETPSDTSAPRSAASDSLSRPRKTLPDITTVIDIIAVALKFSAEPELYFPDANLSLSNLERLYSWTQKSSEEWQIIFHAIDGSGGLTLTQKPIAPELVWAPDEN